MSEIRSYRRVFDLERRIYRVDRLRLNPGGVPVRGVVYLLALLALGVLARALPLVGVLARALPWYLGELTLPCLTATLLAVVRLEGRSFHLAAHALLRHRLGPRRLAGSRRIGSEEELWAAPELLLLPDGSEGGMRRLRYRGPGAVLVAVEHERCGGAVERDGRGVARRGRGRVLSVRPAGAGRALERGQVIALAPGVSLEVRPEGQR